MNSKSRITPYGQSTQKLQLPTIVFLDVDGTIFNSKHEIPLRTKEAVAQLQRLGVRVGLATGRSVTAARLLASELKLTGPHILYAGALLVDGDFKPLGQQEIKREVCVELLEWLEAKSEDFEIYSINDYYSLKETPLLRINWNYAGSDPSIGKFPTTLFDDPILKFQVILSEETQHIRSELEVRFADTIRLAAAKGARHQHLSFISLLSSTALPTNFIKQIWEHIGCEGSFWSAGDGESDIPMIAAADIGIAMGNAQENVKAAANIITPHVDDDGLGVTLLELLSKI